MKKIISHNNFFAIINCETDSDINFELSDLFLSHDVDKFIKSGKVFQKIADCVSSLKTGDRILGAYIIDKTKIWIIADASDEPQRRLITILFPSEY